MAEVPTLTVFDADGTRRDVATLTALMTRLTTALTVNQVTGAADVSVSFARPADTTAYGAGDVVGGPLSFAALGPAASAIMITSLQLEIDQAAAIASAFRLYLYAVTPPSALADNAVFDLPAGDRAAFAGYIDIPTIADLGSTLYVEASNINKQVKMTGTGLFGYLVTIAGYTPTSAAVHKITMHDVTV